MLSWLSPNALRRTKTLSPTHDTQTYILEGRSLMRQDKNSEAADKFQKAIDSDRNCPEAYTYKALALPSDAIMEKTKLCTTAIQLNPSDLMARYIISCNKEENGDSTSASALREEILHRKARTTNDYIAQALSTEDTDKHFSILQVAVKHDSKDPYIHYMIAKYWFSEKNYFQALHSIKEALKIDKEYVDALALKGDILGRQQHSAESLESYNAVLAISPLDIYSLTKKAKAFYKHHNYNSSLELSKRIIQLDDKNHIAYSYIATSLSGLKHFSDALEAINTAITLSPTEVLYYCIRAKIYMFLNQVDYTVQDLNEAFRLHNEQAPSEEEEIENFVKEALKERAELIERITKLSSPSLETIYGAEEMHDKAHELKEERKILVTKVVESMNSLNDEDINHMRDELEEKTAEIVKLQYEISLLRREKSASLIERIEANEHLSQYLYGFSLTWTQTYTASLSVTSGIVKIDTDNLVVTAISTMVSLIPFCSNMLSAITQAAGDFIIKVNILQHANNFAKIAPNHTRLDIIAETVGRKAATYFEEEISNPTSKVKATNWMKKIIKALTDIGYTIEKNLFGELYPSYESKLGHYHASKIIAQISAGEFEIAPKNTLPDRLFDSLLGLVGSEEEVAV